MQTFYRTLHLVFVVPGTDLLTAQYAVAQTVKALRYKPEGRESISNGVTEIFHWHNPSDHTLSLGSIQPLSEMSIWNIS